MSADDTRFLDAATRIGRRLCRDAIWSDGRCNWLGWAMEPHKGQWVTPYRAMGSLLYDGTAGIGLFLARLAQLTRDRIVRTTAEGALAQALTAVEALRGAGEYGFYSGLAGIAWACTEAGSLLEHEELVARGEGAMLHAARAVPQPHRLDIINGSAGLILAVLDAAPHPGHQELLNAAIRHGEHLLATAARGGQGWSWDTLGMAGEKHLLGFAHGTSGIACALAALGVATGRAEFFEGAQAALRYERHHFRVAEGNWPDLRSFVQASPSGEPPCMLAWCHGAPGIGFARVLLHRLLPADPAILAEAETAIRTTAAHVAPGAAGVGNFSLCHGDGGNADLLVLAADALARPELRRIAEGAAWQGLDRFEDARMPWPCGIPNAGESANLLLGLAGIGYFLLRLHDSRSVPTVLLPATRMLT